MIHVWQEQFLAHTHFTLSSQVTRVMAHTGTIYRSHGYTWIYIYIYSYIHINTSRNSHHRPLFLQAYKFVVYTYGFFYILFVHIYRSCLHKCRSLLHTHLYWSTKVLKNAGMEHSGKARAESCCTNMETCVFMHTHTYTYTYIHAYIWMKHSGKAFAVSCRT